MKKTFLFIVFALAMTNVFGANYYWVGGGTSGTPKPWSDGANWSSTSGNVSPGTTGTVPGSADIAIFDGYSANPYVDIKDLNITLLGLTVLPTSTPSNNVLSLVNTATSFTVSGNLTINTVKPSTTQYNGQISDIGNNTIFVGGNIVTNASSSFTLVTCPLTNSNTAPGRIAFTGATPSITGQTGGNLGFLNMDISGSTNLTFNAGNALTINGNLNIQQNGKLTINKTLQFISTAPTGSNPFNTPGTISGPGVIVGNTSWTPLIQGTLPSSYNMTTNIQSVGTIYLDPTSATTSSMNGISQTRPNSTVTFGKGFLSSNIATLAVAGSITMNGGVLNDGGNTITVAGSTTIISTNTTAGAAVHTGNGRIKAIRGNAGPVLVTAGKNVTVGNLEIGSASGAVAYAVGINTNLTINGTLTLSKLGASVDMSGSTVTFQNSDTPISWTAGTINTNSATNLNFGSTGNTAGAAFTIPNSVFTAAPSIASFTINRDNALTLGNQALNAATLNLTKGLITLGATNLTAGTSISGGSATSYVVTDGAGTLSVPVTGLTPALLPIGVSTISYDPATVTATTGTTFSAKVSSTLSGSPISGIFYNPREWYLVPAVASATTISLTPSTDAVLVQNAVIGQWDCASGYTNYVFPYASSTYNTGASFGTIAPFVFVTGKTDTATALHGAATSNINAYSKNSTLMINGLNTGDVISVYNLNGQSLKSFVANAGQSSIALAKGGYVLKVISAGDTKISKVIVQ
ncbi:MAG: T9SS type A sorting domain-containing protein [Bacteroidota bacterium]